MFLNSGKCFGFWDVSSGGLWNVFWILASIFEFLILGCVLDLGTCFVPRPAKGNLSNLGEKKMRRPNDREDRNVEY